MLEWGNAMREKKFEFKQTALANDLLYGLLMSAR